MACVLMPVCSACHVRRARAGGGGEFLLRGNELDGLARRFPGGYTGPRGLCVVLGQQVPHESNAGALHFGGGIWTASDSTAD